FGDECRRTQRGNNNAYCQDNAISWFDWELVESNADLFRFCQGLIEFRKNQPTLHRKTFLKGKPAMPDDLPDVSWFGCDGQPMDWNADDHSLICLLAAWPKIGAKQLVARHLMILCHAGNSPRQFVLPELAGGIQWRLFLNTAADSPHDI